MGKKNFVLSDSSCKIFWTFKFIARAGSDLIASMADFTERSMAATSTVEL